MLNIINKTNHLLFRSPTTPTTPGGGSTASPTSGNQPMFKFTDPALNAKAATVKEQLLQWCQSKTQEYEVLQSFYHKQKNSSQKTKTTKLQTLILKK